MLMSIKLIIGKHKSNEVFMESLSASQPSICNDKQTLGSSSDDLLDNVYSAHEIETREKMSRKRLTRYWDKKKPQVLAYSPQ
jgi:hypothetical protein